MSEGAYWVLVFAYMFGSVMPFPKVCQYVGALMSPGD